MTPRIRWTRRLLPLVAVVTLAGASVLPAAASAPAAPALAPAPASETQTATREDVRTAASTAQPRVASRRAPASGAVAVRSATRPVAAPASVAVPAAPVQFEQKIVAAPSRPSPAAPSASTGSGGTGGAVAPAAYRGRNHVWIPVLGISRSVDWYACSRTSELAHVIYRWGCGGSNNVYLMGHAASVLKPLHDAYVSGRLYKGMKVIYADANGQVRTYSVSYWKVVRPDGDVAWAYAAQSRPSMTLQTCVGAKNSHRLVVRLVATG